MDDDRLTALEAEIDACRARLHHPIRHAVHGDGCKVDRGRLDPVRGGGIDAGKQQKLRENTFGVNHRRVGRLRGRPCLTE